MDSDSDSTAAISDDIHISLEEYQPSNDESDSDVSLPAI